MARIHKALSAANLDIAARAVERRWAGRRSAKSESTQLWKAMDTLSRVLRCDAATVSASDVQPAHVERCVTIWTEEQGLAANTVNKRLCNLSAIGIDCGGNWARDTKRLKWWLRPEQCECLLAHLRSKPAPIPSAELVADYVEWASFVGMRVEESLRLTWADCTIAFADEAGDGKSLQSRTEITVPGTKTSGAQASLFVSLQPALLLARRYEGRGEYANTKFSMAEGDGLPYSGKRPVTSAQKVSGDQLVFPITYDRLHEGWQYCRSFLRVRDNPLSTLKALRRTAARHLTVKGMPTDMVRQYLRHSDIQTTMGYLRLVGGYSTEEQRRWL